MQDILNQYPTTARYPARIKQRAKTILVVDDEETVGIGITEILKDAGFDAGYATSGAGAIEEVKKTPYSLVFMDMVMPAVNGLSAYRKIKELRKGIRVVIFTGFFKDALEIIEEGVKEGMIDEFLRKPLFKEEIIKVARKYA